MEFDIIFRSTFGNGFQKVAVVPLGHVQLFTLPVRRFAEQIVAGDVVVIRGAHDKIESAFADAFFIRERSACEMPRSCAACFWLMPRSLRSSVRIRGKSLFTCPFTT